MRADATARAALEYAGLLAALTALVVFFSLTTQNFFSLETFRAIANQSPAITLVAIGMTFVLVVGGIDLSVGALLGLCGAILGVVATQSWPLAVPVAMLTAMAAGAACGWANGFVSARWHVPAFIVTLGMMEMARGGAYLVTDSRTQYVGSALGWIADAQYLGISLPFALALLATLAAHVTLTQTIFGRRLLALGANQEALRLAGVDPKPLIRRVYLLSGALAGAAAILHTARLQSADPNAGYGFELQAIAAAVIGGTSLTGGRGSMIGAFLGVFIIGVLNAGMAQYGAQEPLKRLVTGAVIVVAVLADHYRRRSVH